VLAFLHTFLIGSDVATNLPLKIYLFVLGILAIGVYFYRTLFISYLVRVFNYKVLGIKALPDKIWEIEFKPEGKEISFKAGQFVFLKFYNSNLSKESHPFTMSSAPGFPLKIAIKELGDYTSKLNALRIGDTAKIEGPFGAFDFRSFKNKKQVWIGGGIGITPFLSMARSLTEKDYDYKIDLYYSVKDENCLAFKEELESIANRNKNLNFVLWVSSKDSFLSAKSIKDKMLDLMDRDVLVCGPGIMMNSIKKQLLSEGAKESQVHIEEFQLY
jgi:predicted ferric reductase